MPTEEVRNHLSTAIGIPAKTHNMEIEPVFYQCSKQGMAPEDLGPCMAVDPDTVYMLLLGECLCENNLGNGDVIKFYKPVGPLKPADTSSQEDCSLSRIHLYLELVLIRAYDTTHSS